MGTFYVKRKVEHSADRARSVVIPKLLVDTGSDDTWVSERALERIGIEREKKDVAFLRANGQQVTRGVGFAIIPEPGDLLLFGARTLGGLNLTIDAARGELVAAGPRLAASPTRSRATSGGRSARKKRRGSR